MKDNELKLFGSEIKTEAERFAKLCKKGKRWGGNAVLIILDSCLDSTGLNYFTVVLPKVNYFREKYIKSGKVLNCSDFSKINKNELLTLFKNKRVWAAMKEICKVISKKDPKKSEIEALKEWAKNADPFKFKEDEIGRIKGVGLSTFQYLRIQSGVDTIMPDKVIMNWITRNFKPLKNPYECISEGMKISKRYGISQTELCWSIWIKESGELNRIKIE
ncbi:MAG: hypothetical protein BJBARM4_0104 [Candidatus Parvarchaeum acidiphilum ARMAN-4]|jgi:hypothetical protein|uniref:HhH-GPD domain-containing protein n=1 Tax=Candidatus Parvarchaeum acidiphilum ARMAN-4 TaxID=662760 RepID=D2EEG4_PARA4|nr:MAG: hypothetical protein BJBARM4_0104 [Candidatus Parvarchaeum acidiphilum ARMAN-4]